MQTSSLVDGRRSPDRPGGAVARPPAADAHLWRAPVVLGLVTVAFGMAYALIVAPLVVRSGGWWISRDVWIPLRAGGFVANGALGYVYESTPLFVNPPLLPIVLAPIVFVEQHFGLVEGYPRPIPHPSMWLVYGPYGLALCTVLYYGVYALAAQLGIVRGRLAAQVAVLGLVVFPAAIMWGHYEDVLALAFVLLSIRALLRRRLLPAALLFGVAVAFKQWALLGLPLIIAASPSDERRKVLGWSLALPGLLVAFPLAVDWTHASAALIKTRSFPSLSGHRALWVSRSVGVIVGNPSRVGAFLVAIAIAWWLRGRNEPGLLLAGFGLIFLSRLLFEPVLFAYYPCPALCLLLLHERVTAGTYRRTVLLGTCLLLWFALQPPTVDWWLVAAGLAGFLAAPAVRDVWKRQASGADAIPAGSS
jgi:hypothetical protein